MRPCRKVFCSPCVRWHTCQALHKWLLQWTHPLSITACTVAMSTQMAHCKQALKSRQRLKRCCMGVPARVQPALALAMMGQTPVVQDISSCLNQQPSMHQTGALQAYRITSSTESMIAGHLVKIQGGLCFVPVLTGPMKVTVQEVCCTRPLFRL